MTLKDTILKFLCLKPQMKTYQNKVKKQPTKTYRTTYRLDARHLDACFGETCDKCKSKIQKRYKYVYFQHFVTENNIERFFSKEEKLFCDFCCLKVVYEVGNKAKN